MRRSFIPVLIAGAVIVLAGCGTAASSDPGDGGPSSESTASQGTPSEAESVAPDPGDISRSADAWHEAVVGLPQVEGTVPVWFRHPVVPDGVDVTWPDIDSANPPTRTADVTASSADLNVPFPADYDPASCPTLEQIVGPTTRAENDELTNSRFLYAGQVAQASLWHDYPETLYDVTVIAPYAGAPANAGWTQFLRAHGDPLALSGTQLGWGIPLPMDETLLIAQTSQNTQSANGYPDQLPYVLRDGWWEPLDPALVLYPPSEPQLDRFPVACLTSPTN